MTKKEAIKAIKAAIEKLDNEMEGLETALKIIERIDNDS